MVKGGRYWIRVSSNPVPCRWSELRRLLGRLRRGLTCSEELEVVSAGQDACLVLHRDVLGEARLRDTDQLTSTVDVIPVCQFGKAARVGAALPRTGEYRCALGAATSYAAPNLDIGKGDGEALAYRERLTLNVDLGYGYALTVLQKVNCQFRYDAEQLAQGNIDLILRFGEMASDTIDAFILRFA
jgi:hypothetical protein